MINKSFPWRLKCPPRKSNKKQKRTHMDKPSETIHGPIEPIHGPTEPIHGSPPPWLAAGSGLPAWLAAGSGLPATRFGLPTARRSATRGASFKSAAQGASSRSVVPSTRFTARRSTARGASTRYAAPALPASPSTGSASPAAAATHRGRDAEVVAEELAAISPSL